MDLTAILIALAFSAFFSGMEIAFLASNRLRMGLEMKRDTLTASILSMFYGNSEQYISTLLVGNNIALVVYGIMMAEALHPVLANYFSQTALIVLLQTIISTIIVLITAEFLPKTVFRLNPNFWLKLFVIPLAFIYIVLYPVSRFSTWLSKAILRLCGKKINEHPGILIFGKADLDYFIQQSLDSSQDNTDIDTEVKIFQNVLDFSTVKIRDCVVPRTEIVAVEWNAPLSQLMEKFIETGKSKIIVFRESIDNIIGYIHSSELFSKPKDWRSSITQISVVPETMSANALMKEFLQQRKSLAVVVDEFGGTAGIVALEDILEEIIGNIEDEHDSKTPLCKQLKENEYIFSGRAEIDQINDTFGLKLPENDSYATVAGYLLHHLQRFPKLNEEVRIDPYIYKVVKVSNSKIEFVRLYITS